VIPAPPFRRRLSVKLLLALVCLAPFLYEGGLICFARWTAILGRVTTVRTPVLDTIGSLARDVCVEGSACFRNVPWRGELVIGVGFATFALCALMLCVRRAR
jgi:hypothetical protein